MGRRIGPVRGLEIVVGKVGGDDAVEPLNAAQPLNFFVQAGGLEGDDQTPGGVIPVVDAHARQLAYLFRQSGEIAWSGVDEDAGYAHFLPLTC